MLEPQPCLVLRMAIVMKKSMVRSFPRFLLPWAALLSAVFAACGQQSEGTRCSLNTDCSDGLVCTKSALLQGTTQNLCCPSDLTKATASACKGAATIQPEVDDSVDAAPMAHDGHTSSSTDAGVDAANLADSAATDASGGQ